MSQIKPLLLTEGLFNVALAVINGHSFVKQKIKKPPTKPVLVKLGDKRPKPKKKIKKNEGPTIYSSEYLEKKHGIKIQSSEKTSSKKYKKAQ